MDQLLKELRESLRRIADSLHAELQGVRSNRPSVELIDHVRVECYGQTLTVREVGTISIAPPRTIEVSIWDSSILNDVVKAIEANNAGLSVSTAGNLIRITLPTLTDERRAEYTKLAKKIVEQARIAIRGQRDDVMKKIKALQDSKEVSEDQAFKTRDQVQKIVDDTNKEAERLLENKIAEIAE